jgi:hypothetical protein
VARDGVEGIHSAFAREQRRLELPLRSVMSRR